MAATKTTPNPVAQVGVVDVFSSAALDTHDNSATRRARQARTSAQSIPSIDFAILRLARRPGISLGHAVLAEAHGIGGAA